MLLLIRYIVDLQIDMQDNGIPLGSILEFNNSVNGFDNVDGLAIGCKGIKKVPYRDMLRKLLVFLGQNIMIAT